MLKPMDFGAAIMWLSQFEGIFYNFSDGDFYVDSNHGHGMRIKIKVTPISLNFYGFKDDAWKRFERLKFDGCKIIETKSGWKVVQRKTKQRTYSIHMKNLITRWTV